MQSIIFNSRYMIAALDGAKTTIRCCPAPGTEYHAGQYLWVQESFYYNVEHDNYYYSADHNGMGTINYIRFSGLKASYFPPHHLPRFATRLYLEIQDVRQERLQDMSEADAAAEGCQQLFTAGTAREEFVAYKLPVFTEYAACVMAQDKPQFRPAKSSTFRWNTADTALEEFAFRWDMDHDREHERWAANPLVSVIIFKIIPEPNQESQK